MFWEAAIIGINNSRVNVREILVVLNNEADRTRPCWIHSYCYLPFLIKWTVLIWK